MRDLFVENGAEASTRTMASGDPAQEIREAIASQAVCPFCGAVRDEPDGPCPRCTMENTSASRQATKSRIGPWYVLQSRNAAAPGMKFETLLGFVRKGRVKARSVVRGPTTHQLWRFAAHVKGLSREFGICYSCGGSIERTSGVCPHCNRLQEPPENPDVFLEGQEPEPQRPTKAPSPARHPVGPTPLAAEDIVVPPLVAQAAAAPARDPLDAAPTTENTARKGGDGFLSPHDLAAAFNLDFRPRGKAAQTRRAFQQEPRYPSRPKRRRRVRRYVICSLFLAVCVVVGYELSVKPDLRAQVLDYGQRATTWSKQKWSQLKPSPGNSHSRAVLPPAPNATASQTADSPTTLDFPAPMSDQKQSQVPAPSAQKAAQTSPWDKLYQEPASTPSSSKAAADNPSAKPSHTGTLQDMRKLYWDAIDAEAQGDFAMAVKKYEQIQQLPQDLWPRDLDQRLAQARKQAH